MFKCSDALVSVLGLFLALLSIPTAFAFEFDKKLLAPDGKNSERFGSSVTLNGTIALVGTVPFVSVFDDRNSTGSAYLIDVTTGNLLHKFTDTDGVEGDDFGFSVSLLGNTALVSSPSDSENSTGSGSAFVFDATTGNLLYKLTVPNSERGGRFGESVSLNNDTVLVGTLFADGNEEASGAAYLFDVTNGDLLRKLIAPDGQNSDRFGASVSLYNNTALVGSVWDDDNGVQSGAAYLFDVTTGDLLHKLTAPDGVSNDLFGQSVSLYGNTALVASPFDDDNGENSGSAYLFDVNTGDLLQKLTASDSVAGDFFGQSVSLFGDTALVGSPFDDDNGEDSGSAYLFDVTTGNLLQKLNAPDSAAGDFFGWSVSLSGDTVLVGSRSDDNENGSQSGSAYVFKNASQSVPEPSMILGLFAVGSLGAWLCRGKG